MKRRYLWSKIDFYTAAVAPDVKYDFSGFFRRRVIVGRRRGEGGATAQIQWSVSERGGVVKIDELRDNALAQSARY